MIDTDRLYELREEIRGADRCTHCGGKCWLGWYLCERCLITAGLIRPGFNPFGER